MRYQARCEHYGATGPTAAALDFGQHPPRAAAAVPSCRRWRRRTKAITEFSVGANWYRCTAATACSRRSILARYCGVFALTDLARP